VCDPLKETRFQLSVPAGFLLPFTVTKPVTNRELSIAVVSRDVIFVFGKISKLAALTFRSMSLDCR